MIDPIRRLLSEASAAKETKAFWQSAARVVSERAGGAQVRLTYRGLSESGTVGAGPDAATGDPLRIETHDAEGRRVDVAIVGAPAACPLDELRALLEVASHLAVMVARRASLERERRFGTFLVELSRWLLAAPDRELLLRYTLQSVASLMDAQGAYVALRNPDGKTLRIAATVGRSAEMQGLTIPIASTTGRVTTTREALVTDNVLLEADSYPAASPSGTARAAMIAPLNTSTGAAGAVGVVRYVSPAADPAAPGFSLVDLQYFTAVAAHIAGGLQLAEDVAGAHTVAQQARAMVNGSPLPLALVDRDGRLEQLNQAGCHLFDIPDESNSVGKHLESLGLSPSGVSLRMVLARALEGDPWHGRVLVTRGGGDRRICDCTVTGLTGVDSSKLLVALYDRTDELRAERELVAREKLATVGEIASGVAHEVNNPLAAIRMEAELLGRASKDPDVTAARPQSAPPGASCRHDPYPRPDERAGARRDGNPPARAALRQRRVSDPDGRRRSRRPRPGPGAPAGGHQPGDQRGARDPRPPARDHPDEHAGARGLGAARRGGFRTRRAARHPAPHLRPLLHHQGAGRRHGPRPRHLSARRERGGRQAVAGRLRARRRPLRGGAARRSRALRGNGCRVRA